ncbi:MAG: rhodanese-like domain-containing protein [Chitinophagaceae bacterium]|jgi:rhodanese-related sulfurtransferase
MKDISVQELKTLMDNNDALNIIDVREPDEHAEFNIGGILLPLGKIMSFQLEDVEELKDQEVYVYCRSGKRSMQACMVLEQAGFEHVNNVNGGILAWQEQIG